MWIVVNALLLYNVAVDSGRFDAFRDWLVDHLPNDRRVILVVVAFCFGALLEGIAGFGTPVAITSALLILVGFPALEALTFTLIFNTAPVAFGALGVPITVLGTVTHLPAAQLGAMVGRQLPFLAVLLPFYVMAVYGGWRSVRALWPMLLVAGGGFAADAVRRVQLHRLQPDRRAVLAGLDHRDHRCSCASGARGTIRRSRSAPRCRTRLRRGVTRKAWQGWLPWIVVSAVVIVWTTFQVFLIGRARVPWPGLHNAVAITLYQDTPYAAVWDFQPLGTGTAILLAAIITAALVGMNPRGVLARRGADLAAGAPRDPDGGADHRRWPI